MHLSQQDASLPTVIFKLASTLNCDVLGLWVVDVKKGVRGEDANMRTSSGRLDVDVQR